MPRVFPPADIPVIAERAAATRFPAGQAAEDGRLVRSARAGDESAFARLYDRYGRIVHALLLARVSRDEVEDLVQDVFLTAWRRLDDLRDPAAFGGWISMIARNRATDAHRRSPEFVELPADLAGAGGASDEAEAHAALAAIRSLPDAYRETLVLRLVEGMTGPEIAERTGLTPASVRVNLHRGMKLLREKLDR
ncbi:MAG TPA: sigma-70 family RNA polymerase sigma factor [Vicinamibacterales bacterium]|nr:sigma-70 family RNA polymerase sigma factor [Vicinamibacterales bacterium]